MDCKTSEKKELIFWNKVLHPSPEPKLMILCDVCYQLNMQESKAQIHQIRQCAVKLIEWTCLFIILIILNNIEDLILHSIS